ncbi:MAG: hypothetical protein JSS04_15250 [Proteobacteria bacterium]|nr:hypothetical protein [Pseudomonadota bacterium]
MSATTAASTIAPPTSVAVDGVSAKAARVLRERFDQQGGKLFREWSALPKHGTEG